MTKQLILASASKIRARLLESAGLKITIHPARIEEGVLRDAMLPGDLGIGNIATALADAKAKKVAADYPNEFVLGCDQIASSGLTILAKPTSKAEAIMQLQHLSGGQHQLFSAAVLYENGQPVWQNTGIVTMQMHQLSDAYIESYVDRNWDSIRHSVGCYKLEEEGVRLFSAVKGDYFHVLGLPLSELLSYLTERGVLEI